MKKHGVLNWNLEQVAKAFKITVEEVRKYFTDSSNVSFLLESRIASEVLNGRLAISEGAGYDLIDSEGNKWEVRSISRGGIYFCPSYMVGSGRSFNKKGFLKKLEEIKGYVVSDIESFPEIRFWLISSEQVKEWWDEGKLGNTTKVQREKILKLLESLKF